MKQLLWSLALLPTVAIADYQYDIGVGHSILNLEGVRDEGTISEYSLEDDVEINSVAIAYYFSPVNTDVEHLTTAEFLSRSSSIAAGYSQSNTDRSWTRSGFQTNINNYSDRKTAVLGTRVFYSENSHVNIIVGNRERKYTLAPSLGQANDETQQLDDTFLYSLGAGYYINDTSSISFNYSLEDIEFGSLSAAKRRASISQTSILSFKNDLKFLSKSHIEFERSEDIGLGEASKEYERSVGIGLDWLVNKNFSIGGAYELDWEDLGRSHDFSLITRFYATNNFKLEAAAGKIISDYHNDTEIRGTFASVSLSVLF